MQVVCFPSSPCLDTSDQRKSLLRKKAVALVGWMGEACGGGGKAAGRAAAVKLTSMSVSVPQQLSTAALRVLLMPNRTDKPIQQ
jgi:hypothetical protein